MQHSKNVIAACFARKSSTYVFMYTRNLIIMKMFCSTQTKIALPSLFVNRGTAMLSTQTGLSRNDACLYIDEMGKKNQTKATQR